MRVTDTEERWARSEQELYTKTAVRLRRTPGIVIGILALLILAVGLTSAVDLRRLQTPRGAALAWVESAVFGDCRAFLALSRPVAAEPRSSDELCSALRRRTASARATLSGIRIELGQVRQQGPAASVRVVVGRQDGVREVPLRLVRT